MTSEVPKLAALSYASAIYALFFNLQPVLVGVLQKTFGFDEQQLGEVLSAGFFASCLVLGSSYFWVNRVRRRVAIVAGIAIALAGLVVNLFASGFVTVVLGMMLLGGGLAIIAAPVVQAMGALSNPTKAFGYGVSAMVLLAAVCVYLIPIALFPAWGYPGVLVFLMLLIALTLFLLPFIPDHSPIDSGSPRLLTGSSAFAWIALAATVVYILGLNSNWAFFELLGNRAHIDTETIGLSISAGLLVGVIGSLAAAILHNRVSVTLAMGISVSGFLVYVWMISATNGPVMFGVSVAVFCIIWNFGLPYTMDLVRAYDTSGRMLAMVPAAQALGGALGPLAAGSFLVITGPDALYGLLMFCVVIGAIIFIWLERRILTGS